jgi:hypothetical protein
MHIRRQLTLAVRDAIAGIPGVVGSVKMGKPVASLQPHELPGLFIYNDEGRSLIASRNRPAQRPIERTFRVMTGTLVSRDHYAAGVLDEVSGEIERRVFADAGIRAIAKLDVALTGEVFDYFGGPEAVAVALIFDFSVRMTEGDTETVL